MKLTGDFNTLISKLLLDKQWFGKIVDIEVKLHKERRSLDANNYFWLLLSKLAPLLHSKKDELYLRMLEDYGVFIYLPATEAQAVDLKKVFRIVRNRGEVELTTQSGRKIKVIQWQCYKGSSIYDTKEMAHLIDGVVSECKAQGIETLTPDELERMKQAWRG